LKLTGSSNGSSGVILSTEDVARRPGNLSTKVNECLNQDGSLDCCVETSSNTSALQRLILGILLTNCHQSWHLIFSELDLLATEGSKTEVSDL
jgi:hypothetical protein